MLPVKLFLGIEGFTFYCKSNTIMSNTKKQFAANFGDVI